MRVCVVGSGAREHALAHVLARSADVVATPGNPGIDGVSAEGHRLVSTPAPPEEVDADLFVVGPEAPLVAGLADRLRARGAAVVGPGAAGAALEGSKAFMKRLAAAAGVPTARFGVFDRLDEAEAFLASLPGPYVVKTDGLAAGKGVLVTADLAEARADARAKLSGAAFGDAGRRIVVEEGLEGPELSLLVLCDGRRALPLPPARDFKRALDGDAGPNTGGMGAYSPVPDANAEVVGEVMARIVEPTLAELGRRRIDYRGVLYAGCMLTAAGPVLIEYNVRFGDPEAEVVLPRLRGDVAGLLHRAATGRLPDACEVADDAAVCVVVASPGYPLAPRLGGAVTGLDEAATVEGVTVFHAGTRRAADGTLRAGGGRVLAVTAVRPSLAAARAAAYEAVGRIRLAGATFRRDIGADAPSEAASR
ncbi:MAG TPA: phosphoribosylamine--glycine ligase [Acidimicrobiales bacterium]|nr:phosphoribosylamine--glycine ligase [Acidimicrobiales bacterium]